MNRINVLIVSTIILMFFASMVSGLELKTEPAVVELFGRFVKPNFKDDETGEKGCYYAIQLVSPVDVSADEFDGPAKNITTMQLVFMGTSASTIDIVKKYNGKKIKITGSLFHRHTAHHMTKVLVTVMRIEEQL